MIGQPARGLATRLQNTSGEGGTTNRRHKADHWLLILGALLVTVGLIVVYSISPGLAASQNVSQGYFVTKQIIDVLLGVVAFTAATFIPISFWKRAIKPLAIAAGISALVVMLTPVNALYPAHRWIRLGSYSFQVAELIKLVLILWTANFLTKQWREGKLADFNKTLKPLLIIMAVVGVIVAKFESDLGSTGVMVAIIGLMAFTVGIPLKRVATIAVVILALLVLAISSSAYRRDRLTTFLHPETNCQDSGYQACQALISVGSGGLMGLGLGYSVQAYGYLPEASNDSIFAIMAEKFGFIGTVSILVIYGAFITRLKQIIERTSDQFSRLVVVGVLAWLSTQAFINIGAMLGLLPLKGITLPLISQGGTSLIFLAAALGLIFQISRYTSYSNVEPKTISGNTPTHGSSNGRRVGGSYNPSIVSRPRT